MLDYVIHFSLRTVCCLTCTWERWYKRGRRRHTGKH